MLNVAQALAALKDIGYKVWDASEHDTAIQLIARIYGLEPSVVFGILTGNGWGD
jgi:hypothetical protein